jgi:hypothetical protein
MTMRTGPLIATLALFVLFGDGFTHARELISGASVFAAPNLTDLNGVGDLKARFNHDTGKVRLVLLMSPT